MRPNYEDSTARPEITTPYDGPKKLWERLVFPSLAVAYTQGYQDAQNEIEGV